MEFKHIKIPKEGEIIHFGAAIWSRFFQKNIFKDKHNLHKTINAKINPKIRIKYNEVDPQKTTQKDRSLRTIVAKKMMQLNRSDQEKTLSMLTSGP